MWNHRLNYVLQYSEVGEIRHTIAVYLKKHVRDVPYMSIGEVADGCHVSKGMMTKFAHEIGYDSYSDLKEDCAFYIQKIDSHITDAGYMEDMLLQLQAIGKMLDRRQIEGLAKEIQGSRCVYLYSSYRGRAVLMKFQAFLDQCIIPAVIMDEELKHHYEIKEGSTFLIFDFEEQSHNRMIRKFKQYSNCNLWLITNHEDCTENHLLIPAKNSQVYLDFLFIWIEEFVMNF